MMATMNGNGENGRSLPDGWEWSTLANCVDILDGRRVPINSGEREQRIAGKEQSELIPYYGSTGHVGWIDDFIFDEEILLLGEDAAPFLELTKDKAYVVRGKSWVNNHAHVLRAKSGITTNLFLKHYLNIFDYHEYVTGTTRLKLNQGRMRVMPVPLPPLPEQERIANRIEELLSDLDAGVAALERVQVGLKRYKASVLKAAIEGRLFESRKAESGNELPDGWRWARAEDICGFITKGTTPKSDKLFAGSGDVPFIKVYNLTFDGSLDFSINPTFVSKETHTGELARSKIVPGDVLMNIVGPPLGKVSIVPDTFPEWNMNQAVARFRPLEICDRKYLSIALRTESVLSWAVKRAKATAGQFNLTLEICRDLPIPLPPLDEQRRTVAEVERRLSVVGEVESAVEVGLVRAGRLRQSVLRSAFVGRL